jgi:hypothetical protein
MWQERVYKGPGSGRSLEKQEKVVQSGGEGEPATVCQSPAKLSRARTGSVSNINRFEQTSLPRAKRVIEGFQTEGDMVHLRLAFCLQDAWIF